eukprot:641762-Prorocentrum_lima.AAC.1
MEQLAAEERHLVEHLKAKESSRPLGAQLDRARQRTAARQKHLPKRSKGVKKLFRLSNELAKRNWSCSS